MIQNPMMPGFNLPTGPIQQYTPEILAQMAAAGFHPPGAMGGGGGMGGGAPGFNIGDGMAGLGAGLGAYAKGQQTPGGPTDPEGNRSGFPQNGGPQGPSDAARAAGGAGAVMPNGQDPLAGIPAGFPPNLWMELFGSK